jgi:hypothetical protein
MLSYIFLLLALRSFVLAVVEKKAAFAKIIDYTMGTVSVVLFLVLPGDFQWKPLTVIAAVIGISMYRRISQGAESRRFSFQTLASFACLYTLGAFAALSSIFFRMSEEKKIGKIVLTGQTKTEWVDWKNPANEKIESAWLDTYEVVIEDPKGHELSRQFVYGDLVGIRAEIITIEWPFQLLGFSNLCHLEAFYNGYATAKRHNFLPHMGYQLPFAFKGFQMVWEKLYRGEWKVPGLKNSKLESVYFPLTTADLKPNVDSFWLTGSMETVH